MGPLSTDWSDETYPVQWGAPYAPFLPDDVKNSLADADDNNLSYLLRLSGRLTSVVQRPVSGAPFDAACLLIFTRLVPCARALRKATLVPLGRDR